MGGHEIFMDLDNTEAYENCPGHRNRRRIGRLDRDATSATVIGARETPLMRFEWNGSSHSVHWLLSANSSSLPIAQTTNPWRLWIPRFLPED